MAQNINQITAPRVDFLDQNGKIAREWYMYLYNLYTITGGGTGVTPVVNGGTGLSTIPSNGQLLIGNGTGYTLNTLGAGAGISVTNGSGTITVANVGVLSFSGGTTGLTPVAAAVGVVTLGGTLIAANGGTGQSFYAVGDLLYANTTTTLAKLADVATGNALISGGVGVAPSWGKIGLTTHVSGVLPIANGGTNSTATPTAYGVTYGTGSAYAFTAAGTTGQVLTATTGGAPTWAAPATSGTVTSVGLSLPVEFTVTNSPVTSSGTLTATWASETAKYFFAAPNAANGTPSFRAIIASDIPALSYVSSVTGTSPVVSSGGLTPAISLAAAYGDTLNPYAAKTANYVLAGPTTGAAAVPTFRALVSGDIPSLSYVTSVTGTAPVVSSGGLTPAISMAAANTTTNGYLTSTDWNTFNNKGSGTVTSVAALTLGTTGTDLTSTVANGTTTPVITLNVPTASATNRGALSAADWTTFNNKGSGTVTSVTGTAPVVSSGGATPAISMAAASTSTNGYLTSTDWNTFNGKGSGTVTAVSVVSANGFAGTSSGGATPALTLSTTITGLLKGNGTAISAAVVNTDYFAPSAPVTKTADFTVAATDVWLINNKSGSTCTATLPAASSWTGRVLRFQNYQVQTLVSASSNVVPLTGGAAATSILLASSGDSATLVSDGTNWLMTQYIPNNILLLE
jgi:hypothetical protein